MKVSTFKVRTPPKSDIVSNITKAIPAKITGFIEGIITFFIADKLLSPRDLAALKILNPTFDS